MFCVSFDLESRIKRFKRTCIEKILMYLYENNANAIELLHVRLILTIFDRKEFFYPCENN